MFCSFKKNVYCISRTIIVIKYERKITGHEKISRGRDNPGFRVGESVHQASQVFIFLQKDFGKIGASVGQLYASVQYIILYNMEKQ